MRFKFTRKSLLKTLSDEKKYTGKVYQIKEFPNKPYLDVQVEIDEGIISIWVSDNVNPDHPLFDVFCNYIKNDEDASNFDLNKIVGTPISFTVKNIAVKNSKGEDVERTFFDKVKIVSGKEEKADE